MALNDVFFTSEIKDSPAEITQKYLLPAFNNSSTIYLITMTGDLRALADLTWGISGFRKSINKEINLVLVGACESSSKFEKPESMSSYIENRLRMLKWYYEQGILKCFNIAKKDPQNENVYSRFEGFLYFIIFLDDEGTIVTFSRYRMLENTYNESVEFEVKWSFGDPKNTAEKFEKEIKDILLMNSIPSRRPFPLIAPKFMMKTRSKSYFAGEFV